MPTITKLDKIRGIWTDYDWSEGAETPPASRRVENTRFDEEAARIREIAALYHGSAPSA